MDEMKSLKKEMRLIVSTILINIKTILFFGALGFLLSLIVMFIPIDNVYSASSAVCSTLINDYDNTKSIRMMESFIDLFDSSLILVRISEATGNSVSPGEIRDMTTIKKSNSRTILTIITRHKNPAIAIKTANAIANAMIIEIDKLFESSSGIKVLDQASSAWYVYKGRNIHFLICFLLTFFSILGCSAYYITKTLASNKVLFIEDCTIDGSLEIFGVIPFSSKKHKET